MLDFVAFAARPMPLVTLLDEAPRASPDLRGATCARSTCSRATGASSSCAATSASRTGARSGAPVGRRGDHGRGRRVHAAHLDRPARRSTRRTSTRRARRGALPDRSSRSPSEERAGRSARSSSSAKGRAFDGRRHRAAQGARRARRGGRAARGAHRRGAREAGPPVARAAGPREGHPPGPSDRRGRTLGAIAALRGRPRGRLGARAEAAPTPTLRLFARRLRRRREGDLRGLTDARRRESASARTRPSSRRTRRSWATAVPRAGRASSLRDGRGMRRRARAGGARGDADRRDDHPRRVPRGARARHRGPVRRALDARRERQARRAAVEGDARRRQR